MFGRRFGYGRMGSWGHRGLWWPRRHFYRRFFPGCGCGLLLTLCLIGGLGLFILSRFL